jgi:hypothetical protein
MTMKFEFKPRRQNVPDSELIEDVQRCARKLQRNPITKAEYQTEGSFDPDTLVKRFQSWSRVLELSGLKESRWKGNISDDELFDNLRSVWTALARQPRYKEFRSPLSKYSPVPYEKRFGTWNQALEAFIKWVEQGQDDPCEEDVAKEDQKVERKRTKRGISERLRFSILLRDGFRCLSCGRSPLKSPGVELHVDHVIPWSAGGETVPDNLKTKCADCNLGKGNAFRE